MQFPVDINFSINFQMSAKLSFSLTNATASPVSKVAGKGTRGLDIRGANVRQKKKSHVPVTNINSFQRLNSSLLNGKAYFLLFIDRICKATASHKDGLFQVSIQETPILDISFVTYEARCEHRVPFGHLIGQETEALEGQAGFVYRARRERLLRVVQDTVQREQYVCCVRSTGSVDEAIDEASFFSPFFASLPAARLGRHRSSGVFCFFHTGTVRQASVEIEPVGVRQSEPGSGGKHVRTCFPIRLYRIDQPGHPR